MKLNFFVNRTEQMDDNEPKKCKKKGCDNIVLDGKYCEFHKQKKKETRDNALKVCGVFVLSAVSIALNKDKITDVFEDVINKS